MKAKTKKNKKTVSKVLKKKTARKVIKKAKTSRGKKVVPKKRKKSKAPTAKKAQPAIQGTLVGHVTHYFPHVNAAAIRIKKGSLQIGDQIYIKGHTTDFKETIISLQKDRQPIQKGKKGDEVGIQVKDRVREHDAVYKL